ncbi:MAG: sulfurtransferase TusA family protein [Sideroxyarcus sp.]|nr:sulfurtransferase TusA family protein [Sideroxyarcus sp.]
MNNVAFDVELDVRELVCPLPILRAKKSLSAMTNGQVLKVMATDKETPTDFEVFCRQTGNELLSSEVNNDEFVFLIRRRS